MESISLATAVDADPRPTLVLDLHTTPTSGLPHDASSYIAHENPPLRSRSHLRDDVLDRTASSGLKPWLFDRGINGPVSIQNGHLGTYIVQDRWRVIQWSLVDHRSSNAAELKDALADRDDATAKLQCLLKMMDMVDVGFFEYDKKGKLVYGNEAFYHLSGHPRDSTKDEVTWQDAIFPEDGGWLMEHWIKMTQGVSMTFEMRWKRPRDIIPNGEDDLNGQWVLAACVPTTDANGDITSISGCLTDIAAQKQGHIHALKKAEALERAHAVEARFTRFAEMANIAIWILNSDYKITYANEEWFKMSGHHRCEPVEVDWSTLVNESNLALIEKNLLEMAETKCAITFSFEFNRLWRDGDGHEMRVTCQASAYPELDEGGSIVAVAGTLVDITHLRWAEVMQRQRTDEAIEAKRQQENFIDTTCHEIRTPLGAVVHCADLAHSSLSDLSGVVESLPDLPSSDRTRLNEYCESANDAINIIISCCGHQKRIVDDILTLSKLDSKLLTIAPAPANLRDLLREVSSMFDADARKADVDLRIIHDQSLEKAAVRWVVLDSGRLMQVLINLITNALKFTQKETVRAVALTVGASRNRPSEKDLGVDFMPAGVARDRRQSACQWGSGEDVFLHFKVTDTGCGFDEEQKTRIFGRFSQASPRTHSKYGGSGLGLFISREMIELQGGEIGVDSTPGEGSIFAFYIAARTTSGPVGEIESDPLARLHLNGSREQRRLSTTSQYTILVVEDNLVNQKVLRMQLQKLNHKIHVVSHGGEALEFLQTTTCWKGNDASKIDLSVVLMDIEMPVMGGKECARRIRKLQEQGTIQCHLPIIAVSANARDAQVSDALESGMDDAISKPFRVVDLIPKIKRLVNG